MEKENELDIKDEDLKEDDFSSEELEAEDVDWKAKAQELKGIAKRRATQLSKAKERLGELGKKTSDYEAELAQLKQKPPEKKEEPKPNEPDYAKLAYLHTRGVDHPDDQKAVFDEAERLKLSLSDVLQMEHIQKKLEINKDERNAKAGMPSGTRHSGGASQKDVDYWLQKGGLPENDQELAEKVVNARMKQEQSNKFSDDMFIG